MSSDSESYRLEILRSYEILDTAPEPEYDALVRMAASLCQAPMAIFTVLDDKRQWFKARIGISITGSERCHAFCDYTIRSDFPLIVPDALLDERFRNNPFVTMEPRVRFYAGFPIVGIDGAKLGSLAVLDKRPRTLTNEQLSILQDLAFQTMKLLELRLERNKHRLTSQRLLIAQFVGEMGSWELDTKENKLTWSAETHRIFGIKEGTFGGTFEDFAAFILPEDRDHLLQHQELALSGKVPLDVIHRIRRPNGEIRHVRERGQLMPANGGNPRLLVGTVQDITSEFETKAILEQQQHDLKNAMDTINFHVDNSPLSIVEWDHEFRVVRWSRSAEKLFGWNACEVMGRHPSEWKFIHEDDAANVAKVMSALFAGVASNISPNRNYTKSGAIVYCEWYNSVRLDKEGKLVSIFSLVHDVTGKIRAEQEMRDALQRERVARLEAEQEKAYFRSLFESAPGLYLVLQAVDFKIVAASEAYLESTRTQREAILGRCVFDVFPDDPNEPDADGMRNFRASLARARTLGVTDVMAVQRYPIPVPEEQGGGFEERFWSALNSPIKGPDGKVIYIIHRVEDVTEYIREKEKQGQGAEARHMLASRTKLLEADIVLRSRELERLNEKLRTSEERIRRVFEDASIGIISASIDNKLQQVNRSVAQMLGYSKEEMVGMDYLSLTHPDDCEECMQLVGELYEGKRNSFVMEKRFRHKQGRYIWTRVSVTLQRDAQNLAVGLIAAAEDISDRRAMEEKIRKSEKLADVAGRLGRIAGWSVDLSNNNKVEWSPELYRILEWDGDEPPPLDKILSLYPEVARKIVEEQTARCAAIGESFENEVEVKTFKGRTIIIRANGEAERDQNGHICRLIGAYQDITEQKSVERERERLSVQLATTLESMGDAFYLLDEDWKFVYLNKQAEKQLHRRREDLLGLNIWDEFDPNKETELYENYTEAVKQKESRIFQFYYPPLKEWFEVNATPSVVGLAVYFRTITERLALEEQLRQSQRLESIGQLTGGVAHDFNNLLTVVLGNSELLEEGLHRDDPLHGIAEMIGKAAKRGAELTHRLLAFARKQPLEPTNVDVNRLIEGMKPLLVRTLSESISVKMIMSPVVWTAFVDPVQLESAILNLCLNARDAMPNGGNLIIETTNTFLGQEYTTLYPEIEPGEFVQISISDTGTGIDEKDIIRIFEPFYTTKPEGKGTGLGLSMVYGFVRQSRGHIRVYSEVGHGSSFKIYLPRAERGRVTESEEARKGVEARGSEIILLVEDDDLVRAYSSAQLTALGYRVLVSSSGPEALNVLKSRSDIALLFTDIIMPGGMNGRQLVEAAKKIHPSICVLYTSGYTESVIVHEGRLDPGAQLLSKPYSRMDLARKVREVIDNNRRKPE